MYSAAACQANLCCITPGLLSVARSSRKAMTGIVRHVMAYTIRKPMPDKNDMHTSGTYPLTLVQNTSDNKMEVGFERGLGGL